MASAKDCHELTSYYVAAFKKKYGFDPNVNRYSARWGFDSLLMGMGKPQVKDLLDYYMTTASQRKHDLDWFFYNYEKLVKGLDEAKSDREHRAKLMQESQKRAEEWRNSGKQGITNLERGTKE